MENNKQNLITKIVTYSIVFFGILFTVWVMLDDNPSEMSYEQQKQWAIVEAKSQGLANEMTASELNAHLSNRTSEISLENLPYPDKIKRKITKYVTRSIKPLLSNENII